MNFLPDDYKKVPETSNYMKFAQGDNKFRILSSAIVGYEGWTEKEDGTRKPVRTRMNEPFNLSEVDIEPESIKHFWAFVVYNYKDERVQILQITQKSIQKSLMALVNDVDWGKPQGYDIVVNKKGEKLLTEYSLTPKPAKPLDASLVSLYKATKINLDALFTGEDPFASSEEKLEDIEIPEEDQHV
jgi:hypothetical protein